MGVLLEYWHEIFSILNSEREGGREGGTEREAGKKEGKSVKEGGGSLRCGVPGRSYVQHREVLMAMSNEHMMRGAHSLLDSHRREV